VEVSRKIVESSRRAILVADSLKYGRSAPVRIGHLSDIDHFVTDAALPERLRNICAENQVAVDVAAE
jgi:DeoR family glycerol-3-phosphate regulon repressor